MTQTISFNSSFLSAKEPQLARLASLTEPYFADDPGNSLLKLRQMAELSVQTAAARLGVLASTDEPKIDRLELLERIKPARDARDKPSRRKPRSV